MAQQQVNKGFSLLEWSSKLVPQGALVTGERTLADLPVRDLHIAFHFRVNLLKLRNVLGRLPAYTEQVIALDGTLGPVVAVMTATPRRPSISCCYRGKNRVALCLGDNGPGVGPSGPDWQLQQAQVCI